MSRSVLAAPSTPVFPAHAGDAAIPLSRVAVGWRRVIEEVAGPDRAELEREGVLPGSVVVVTARTPLGGPVVVELGGARLALSARVAGQVVTRPLASAQDPA
jgi:Fe2+ transport system protein FeoA